MNTVINEQSLLSKVLESSQEGILVLNTKGIIIQSNQAAEKIFLCPNEFLLGKSILDFIPEYKNESDTHNIELVDHDKDAAFSISVKVIPAENNLKEIVFMSKSHSSVNLAKNLNDYEKRNRAILKAIPDYIFVNDEKGNYLDVHGPDVVNKLIPIEQLEGRNIKDFLPPDLCDRIFASFKKSRLTGEIGFLEYELVIDDRIHYFEARIVAQETNEYLNIIRDVTYSKKQEILIKHMGATLEMIAKHRDIKFIANHLVTIIEQYLENCHGSVLTIEQETKALKTLSAPNLSKEYCDEVDCLKIGLNVGSCGTAAFLKKEVIVTDISTDRRWSDYKDMAAKYNLKSSWSFPIFSTKDVVVGTFAVYTNRGREITADERKVMMDAAKLLSIAFDSEKVQVSLNESNRRYSALIDNLPGVVYTCLNDKDWTMEYLSKNIYKLSGYESKRFFGDNKITYNSIIHPEDRHEVWKEIQKIIKSGRPFEVTYRIITANKEEKWVWEQGEKIFNAEKNESYLEGYIMDITQKKRAEEILRENENRLRNYAADLEEEVKLRTNEVLISVKKIVAVNQSLENQVLETKAAESQALENQALFSAIAKNFPKGLIVVVSCDFEIIYCEGEVIRSLSLGDQLLKGNTFADITFLNEKGKINLKNRIERTLDGEQMSFEVNYIERYLTVNTIPLYDSNNKITKALFVYHDITHQKMVERNIQESLEQQQELNALKSRFISMASHEFRTPLTAIKSSAILLGKKNVQEISVKKARYLNLIETNIKHLIAVLDDFLVISKLDEGKMEISPEKIDLIEFSNKIVDELSLSIGSDHSFVKQYDCLNVAIYHDPKLLRNIFFNLLTNAIKYSDKGGEISLSLICEGNIINIIVEDKGLGIPEREQKNMFQRFYRASNTVNLEGTGLGLSIVKQYVEHMGGKISFESKVNVGSRFMVELPINI